MKKKLTLLTGVALLGIGMVSSAKAASIHTNLIHNSYIYSISGKRLNKTTLKKNSKITVLDTKNIKGKQYIKIAKDQYVKAVNVALPTKRTLTHNAYIYDKKGKRVNKKVLKKSTKVDTFEKVVINKERYYRISENQYVKVANFKKNNLIAADKKIEKTLKHSTILYNVNGEAIQGDYAQEGTTWEIYGTKIIKGEKYYQTANGYFKVSMFEEDTNNQSKKATNADFDKLQAAINSTSITTSTLQEKYNSASQEVRHDYDQALATAKKVLADKEASVQEVNIAANDLFVAYNRVNGLNA